MGNVPIDKPAYRAALVDSSGFPTPTWLIWFNQLRLASEAQVSAQASLTALTAQVATDETKATALTARVAAEELLTAAIEAKAALVQTLVSALEILVTGHTLELNIQQTEIDLATASLALLSEGALLNPDAARNWSADFDELGALIVPTGVPRNWTAEFDELREYVASIDPPQSGATGAITGAALTEVTSAVLTITGGAAALLAATSIQVTKATASAAGYLSAADWTAFNAKQAALTLPLSIANGGTGAATLLAAGIPTLSASNTFSGGNSFSSAIAGTLGGWLNWTPAVSVTGSMTNTAPTGVTAKYIRIGPLIHFRLVFTTTLGGTASNEVAVAMPVAENLGVDATVNVFNTVTFTPMVGFVAGGFLFLFNPGAVNYALGSTTFCIAGTYQCA